MKIAVVGSGISGLSAAYYLSKKHKVDLFEKQDRFGGHSYTLDVEYNDKEKVEAELYDCSQNCSVLLKVVISQLK
mgnify:CR=1 FL=1